MSNNFKAIRQRAGLTQKEVAKQLNVQQCSISNWECGRYFPNTDNLIRLATIYKCSVEDLYGGVLQS